MSRLRRSVFQRVNRQTSLLLLLYVCYEHEASTVGCYWFSLDGSMRGMLQLDVLSNSDRENSASIMTPSISLIFYH